MKNADEKATVVLRSSVKFYFRLYRLVSLNTKINAFRSINTQGVRSLYSLFFISLFVLMAACQATPNWEPYDGIKRDVYPTKHWQKAQTPEQLGWSSKKLAVAREYSKQLDTAGLMIVDNGVVVDAWGDITKNFQCHSMRKSIMSAIIGVHVDQGNLDLSKTIEELGIDDYPPALTAEEKQATVGDLIKARSGIYHGALGESPGMKAMRPERHSHAPGTFWYYNNWDFNALGTIFEQETGQNLFEALDQQLARPLEMQDFDLVNCRYRNNIDYGTPGLTMHRYYDIRMSARDLARFGLLFLREGRWRDKQLLPRKWVRESTASHSRRGLNSGYGYMWWTGNKTGLYENVHLNGHSYAAAGWGGHRMVVLPWRNLIVVHRVNTDQPGDAVENHQFGRLLWHILDAAGESGIGPKPTLEAAAGRLLYDRQLNEILPGSTIKGPDFLVNLTPDYRFELWSDGKKTDTGSWGAERGKFWLRTRRLTGGRKARLTMVLDGDRLKWFDPQGTLMGHGFIRKEVK